jgi:hypothetical protein
VEAGNITTQPKQGRWAVPMSSLSSILCLWVREIDKNQLTKFAQNCKKALCHLLFLKSCKDLNNWMFWQSFSKGQIQIQSCLKMNCPVKELILISLKWLLKAKFLTARGFVIISENVPFVILIGRPEDVEKIHPNFGKSSQNTCQAQNCQNINIKAQFVSWKHLYKFTFETRLKPNLTYFK